MNPIKKPRQYLESQEQQKLVKRYRKAQALGLIPDYYILTSNKLTQKLTGEKDKAKQARLKAEGMVAGIPDLVLLVPNNGYSALFIEMKKPTATNTKDGGLSKVQLEIHEKLRNSGYQVVTCYSADEGWDAIVDYLS